MRGGKNGKILKEPQNAAVELKTDLNIPEWLSIGYHIHYFYKHV